MKTKITLTVLLLALALPLAAQVSINTDNSPPDSSAMLDVKSTTRGVLLPRMTNAERDAIVNPVPGLMIFNSDEMVFQFYLGPNWLSFQAADCAPWVSDSIIGNRYPGCNETDQHYSIGNVHNASSYHWTVPAGAAINEMIGGHPR